MNLTQEQTWGLTFEMQQANARAAEQNKFIEEQNTRLAEAFKQPLISVFATLDEYCDKVVADRGDQAYRTLLGEKERLFREKFYAASDEVKAQILTQLKVEDVVK